MKITCAHCAKAYDIPDKRLPFGQEISFPCQACKAIIKVDLRAKKPTDPVQHAQPNIPEIRDQIYPYQTSPSSAKDQTLQEGDALKAKIMRLIEDLPSMSQTIIPAEPRVIF